LKTRCRPENLKPGNEKLNSRFRPENFFFKSLINYVQQVQILVQ
jgi:hypothetical protein